MHLKKWSPTYFKSLLQKYLIFYILLNDFASVIHIKGNFGCCKKKVSSRGVNHRFGQIGNTNYEHTKVAKNVNRWLGYTRQAMVAHFVYQESTGVVAVYLCEENNNTDHDDSSVLHNKCKVLKCVTWDVTCLCSLLLCSQFIAAFTTNKNMRPPQDTREYSLSCFFFCSLGRKNSTSQILCHAMSLDL